LEPKSREMKCATPQGGEEIKSSAVVVCDFSCWREWRVNLNMTCRSWTQSAVEVSTGRVAEESFWEGEEGESTPKRKERGKTPGRYTVLTLYVISPLQYSAGYTSVLVGLDLFVGFVSHFFLVCIVLWICLRNLTLLILLFRTDSTITTDLQ